MPDAINTLAIIVSIVLTITCAGAIPFAFVVVQKLSRIETKLESIAWHEGAISDLRERHHDMDKRVSSVERCNKSGAPSAGRA